MSSNYKEIDISSIKTLSVDKRGSLVGIKDFSVVPENLEPFLDFLDALPYVGKSAQLRELIEITVEIIKEDRPFIFGVGAHIVKLGLSHWIIELMKKGGISHIIMNGACAIHDVEIALFGETSEDVDANLKDGTFGLCEETGDFFNRAFENGRDIGMGAGEALGHKLKEETTSNSDFSLLYNAYEMGVPATVHIALGTDIVHEHPGADGGDIGNLTLRDFRVFAERMRKFIKGGLFVNFGSAVIIPEVFLKALAIAFNIEGYANDFTTTNFDQIQHYRPTKNILERPGGRHFAFTGHHEFLLPLFAGILLQRIKEEG